jgi:hypothetical protein
MKTNCTSDWLDGCTCSACIVECDAANSLTCEELQQEVPPDTIGQVSKGDSSWIVLGVIFIAAGALAILALLFVGVFASSFKQSYETL